MTTLHVDYDDADDLIGELDATRATGRMFFATERVHPPGTPLKLVLAFPGLRTPIQLDAQVVERTADDVDGQGVIAELDARTQAALDAIIKHLRTGGLVRRVVRVLVVEDNHHVAELLGGGLKSAAAGDLSFDLTTAVDGKEALERLSSAQFDLLIVDVYLPRLDGPEVIRRARGELGLAAVPILAVSAGGEQAKTVALEAGANTFLAKPVRLRQVVETVRELCALPGVP